MLPAWFRQARRLSFAVLAGTILAFPSATQAQEAMTLTGRVADETGAELATVNVYIDGTDLATITDSDGSYSLVIPASRIDNQQHVLVAGLIGYRAGQETITLLGDDLTINFTLTLDPIGLEEIVAVGQGLTRERRRLGATVNSISDVDIELSRETEVLAAIAGKAPNVVVATSSGAPGAGTYMQIRGAKSVTGGTQPLFVVDGTPYNNNSTQIESSVAGTAVQNRMADLNPDDVESIEILKGPAGAAIYGSSGANGVVLITTKSGAATNTVQANVRFAYNSDNVTAFNDLNTLYGQGSGGAASASSFSWGPLLSGSQTFDHGGELFQTGTGYDVNATLSGGNARTTYFFSGGYDQRRDRGQQQAGPLQHSSEGDAELPVQLQRLREHRVHEPGVGPRPAGLQRERHPAGGIPNPAGLQQQAVHRPGDRPAPLLPVQHRPAGWQSGAVLSGHAERQPGLRQPVLDLERDPQRRQREPHVR
jgi:TonB-dependent SusC/RagA subfamily outer membrane receptor